MGWHEVTLNFLASIYDAKEKDRCFPAGWERDLIEEVRAAGQAGGMDDKKLKQTVIPFAKLKETEALKGGPQVSAALQALLYGPYISCIHQAVKLASCLRMHLPGWSWLPAA